MFWIIEWGEIHSPFIFFKKNYKRHQVFLPGFCACVFILTEHTPGDIRYLFPVTKMRECFLFILIHDFFYQTKTHHPCSLKSMKSLRWSRRSIVKAVNLVLMECTFSYEEIIDIMESLDAELYRLSNTKGTHYRSTTNKQ